MRYIWGADFGFVAIVFISFFSDRHNKFCQCFFFNLKGGAGGWYVVGGWGSEAVRI